jgi:hypothetical protein
MLIFTRVCNINRFIGLCKFPPLLNLNVKPTAFAIIQASGGLGVIGGNTTTFVGLGGCLPEGK